METTMKPKLLLCLALVLSGVIFSATVAEAQPGGGMTFSSLEARIIEARVIFRGTITNDEETNDSYTFGLRVDEILKGKLSGEPLVFTLHHVNWPQLGKLADEQASFLWFVNGSERTIGKDFFDELNPPNNIFLGPTLPGKKDQRFNDGSLVYDADMTLLTNPADILARTRAYAKKGIAVTNFHKIYLPEMSIWGYSTCELVVPVEPALEKTAKHLMAAPQDFISRTNVDEYHPADQEHCLLRAEGVSALQYFKSDGNIKLLRSLLNDSDYWIEKNWNAEYRDKNATNKIYSMRSAAYEVLKGWDVDVSKPITEEVISATGTKP